MNAPLYERIVADIREKIESGEWPPGTKLPTMMQLRRQYDVSESVVRPAMIILKAAGLIYGQQGKGTFVAGRPERSDPS